MADCIFCKIAAGQIPCAKLYEDQDVLAFLDIAPVRPGHALVVPKAHYANLWDLPPALGQSLLAAMQRVGRAVMEATGAGGLNVGMNNMAPAGQLVMHAHFHLIPRHEGDGLRLWPQHPCDDPDDMERLAAAIRGKLG